MHNSRLGVSENIHTITSSDLLHTNSDEISIGFEKIQLKIFKFRKICIIRILDYPKICINRVLEYPKICIISIFQYPKICIGVAVLNLWLQRCKYFAVRGLKKISVLCYNVDSKKSTSGWSLRLMRGGVRSIGFKVWPQSWPFTGLDYVEIMGFTARKSTVFGRKSTEKHAKWGKKPMLLRLGARCCRFESCHFDQIERGWHCHPLSICPNCPRTRSSWCCLQHQSFARHHRISISHQ